MNSIDRRLHLAAECNQPGTTSFDLAAFLERLLLFQQYTVRTHMCQEVEGMVRQLGIVPTMQLIESGVIRIHDNAAQVVAYNVESSPQFEYDLRFIVRSADD